MKTILFCGICLIGLSMVGLFLRLTFSRLILRVKYTSKEDYAVYDEEGNITGYFVSDSILDDMNGGNAHTEESRDLFCKKIRAKKLVYVDNPTSMFGEYEIIF